MLSLLCTRLIESCFTLDDCSICAFILQITVCSPVCIGLVAQELCPRTSLCSGQPHLRIQPTQHVDRHRKKVSHVAEQHGTQHLGTRQRTCNLQSLVSVLWNSTTAYFICTTTFHSRDPSFIICAARIAQTCEVTTLIHSPFMLAAWDSCAVAIPRFHNFYPRSPSSAAWVSCTTTTQKRSSLPWW